MDREMIFVIDDDQMMAECIAKACGEKKVRIFGDVIAAMEVLDEELPELIFMDMTPTGPDGFTMLNELISYPDTMKIPVVIMSEGNFGGMELRTYGVVGVLDKDMMLPSEVREYVERYC